MIESKDGSIPTRAQRTDANKQTGPLAQSLIDHLNDHGYVVLPKVFDHGNLDNIKQNFDHALEQFIRSRGGLEAITNRTFGFKHVAFFPPITTSIFPEWIFQSEELWTLITGILGKHPQCRYFGSNTSFPNSDYQEVHRDAPLLFPDPGASYHPTISVVVNIPLINVTMANGPTEVWPGTHRLLGVVDQHDPELARIVANTNPTALVAEKGSVIVRDLRLIHRGTPNKSAQPRSMLAIVMERDFLRLPQISIPASTFAAWPANGRDTVRFNKIVQDGEHTPRSSL